MFFVKHNGRVISEHETEEGARIGLDALGSAAYAAAIVTGPPLLPLSGAAGKGCLTADCLHAKPRIPRESGPVEVNRGSW